MTTCPERSSLVPVTLVELIFLRIIIGKEILGDSTFYAFFVSPGIQEESSGGKGGHVREGARRGEFGQATVGA